MRLLLLFWMLGGFWLGAGLVWAAPPNNQAPVLRFAPLERGGKTLPQVVPEGKVFRRLIEAWDPDGARDRLTFRLVHNFTKQKIQLIPTKRRGCCLWQAWLVWYPVAASPDFPKQIQIEVTDLGGKTDTVTHRFQVLRAPTPPKITSNPVTQATQGIAYVHRIVAEDSDATTQPAPLSYLLLEGPDGMTLSSNGELRWTPKPLQVGAHPVAVRVSDGQGLTAHQRFVLQVANRPDLPVFVSQPPKGAAVGYPYLYRMRAHDLDPGHVLEYKLVSGPSGVKVHPSGLLRWVPTVAGSNTIVVEVRDKASSEAAVRQTWTVPVYSSNRVPRFVSEPVTLATQGVDWVMSVRGSDPDHRSLQFALVQGPPGMTLIRRASDRSELRWTPGASNVGSHDVVVRMEDGRGGTRWQSFSLRVVDRNDPPRIFSKPPTFVLQHRPFVYQVKAIDPEGKGLRYSLLEGPLSMRMEPDSGRLSWTKRSQSDVKKHTVKVRVEDDAGAFVVQEFELEVLEQNDVPIVTSSPSLVATQGVLYNYDVKANDPDSSTASLFFRLVKAPASMQLGMTTGELRWLPKQEDVGAQLVVIEVLDEQGGRTQQSLLLEVRDVNDPPVVTSEPITSAVLGQTYVYQVMAKDLDGDVLSYALEGGPSSMSLSPQGLLTWKPKKEEIGAEVSFRVQVRVFDPQGASTRQQFQLKVVAENQPPTLGQDPPTQAKEGELYKYKLQTSDPDKDVIRFVLEQSPGGMAISDSGELTWTPSRGDAGRHTVQIRLDDKRGGVFFVNFVIKVEDRNEPPMFVSLPPTEVEVGTSYRYYIRARDFDNPEEVLTYKLEAAPNRMKLDTKTGLLSWDPLPGDATTFGGLHDVVIKATDSSGVVSVTQRFFIHVRPAKEALRFSTTVPSQVRQSTGVLELLRLEGMARVGAPVWFSLRKGPLGMRMGCYSGILQWRPRPEQVGKHEVLLAASDVEGNEARLVLNLTVTDTNDAPRIVSEPREGAVVGKPYVYNVRVEDPDRSGRLRYQLVDSPTSISPANQVQLDTNNGALRWIPSPRHQNRFHLLSLLVRDDQGAEALQSFIVYVAAVNRAPTWSKSLSGEIAIVQGRLFQEKVTALDPDNHPLRYRLLQAPIGMTLTPLTGQLRWTPGPAQTGVFEIRIEVEDGQGGLLPMAFRLNVAEVNDPPKIVSRPPLFARQGQRYEYVLRVEEPERDVLRFRLVTPIVGARLTQSGELRWTPVATQVGYHRFEVRVTDPKGASDTQSFVVRVADSNDPPQIVSKPPTSQWLEGRVFSALVRAVDPENQPLVFQLQKGPKGMVLERVDSTRVLLRWLPTSLDARIGRHSVEVLVRDTQGGEASQRFVLEVVEQNNQPRFVSLPCRDAFAGGAPYSCVVRAEDLDPNDSLQFRLLQAPKGMTLKAEDLSQKDGSTLGVASLDWSPRVVDVGLHSVVLEVLDGRRARSLLQFSLQVRSNEGNPIADAGEEQQVDPGEVTLDGSNSKDPKGKPLRCQWTIEQSPQNPSPKLQDPYKCKGKVLLRKSGLHVFKLVVSSGDRKSAPSLVKVMVRNLPPHAVALGPQGALVGETVWLRGRESSDVNGDALRFSWSQENGEALRVEIQGREKADTSFVPKKPGIYRFRLSVADVVSPNAKLGLSPLVTIAVHEPPKRYLPYAVILAPTEGTVGETLVLDGKQSLQLQQGERSYRWSILPESGGVVPKQGAEIVQAEQEKALFKASLPGAYRVGLVVRVGELTSVQAETRLVIHERGEGGRLPIAQAQSKHVIFDKRVELDGSESIDLLGRQLTFFWKQVDGRDVTWKDAKTARPWFYALRRSDYRLQLQVQGRGAKGAPVEVLIRVNEAGNQPPTAIAGPDLNGKTSQKAKQAIELDGSRSRDPEQKVLTYRWRQVAGYPISLQQAKESDAKATFTAPIYGVYRFSLEVHDGITWSMPTFLNVVVHDANNHVPLANAGEDRRVRSGQSVTLDGSKSSDEDSKDTLIYHWRLLKPLGVQVALNSADPSRPSFTVPDKSAREYVFGLRVDDGKSYSLEDTVRIFVVGGNQPPKAIIEPVGEIFVGDNVALDGSKSNDPDKDRLTYEWKQLSGPAVELKNPTSKRVNFIAKKAGLYDFQLQVSDGYARSAETKVTFLVKEQTEEELGCRCDSSSNSSGNRNFWVLLLLSWVGLASARRWRRSR